MFLVNSRLSHFSVTRTSSGSKSHHQSKYPFFRSYGANWSSSLRVVHPSALEYSSHPPVSVLVRTPATLLEVFLGSMESSNPFHPKDSRPLTPRSICSLDLPGLPSARLDCHPIGSCSILLRHPILKRSGGTGIFVPVFHRLRLSASA